MFNKILIANRGEIACRIARTSTRMGVQTVAVFSDADRSARHVQLCNEAVHIGAAPAAESYLKIDAIIEAAQKTGAEAIHPGYGFLSENAEFADALEAAGLTFIGPTAETIRAMGSKSAAKGLMAHAGVPTTPGYQGTDQSLETFIAEAARIGYPVLLKASAGGGGKGMRLVATEDELEENLTAAQREALSAFGDDRFLIEKYIPRARHLEVQVFGDGHGEVVHMFERDCSVQRRHQKVVEEAPAPALSRGIRNALLQAGVDAAKAVNYRGAGTVEFLYDGEASVYFMEMNTRLQVEHPVSEMITGLDFVEWQLRIAAGEGLPLSQHEIGEIGHAVEARIYAEDPYENFSPSIGALSKLSFPPSPARVDTGVAEGDQITPYYDPMIAKLITHGDTRATALNRMQSALCLTHIAGLETNTAFVHDVVDNADFRAGNISTRFIEDHAERLLHKGPQNFTAIAAAVLWKRQKPLSTSTDPWADLSGFRLNAPKSELFWISYDGRPTLLRLTPTSVGFDVVLEPNASAAARRSGDLQTDAIHFDFSGSINSSGVIKLNIDETELTATAAPHLDAVRIWTGAHYSDIKFIDPLTNSNGQHASEGSLLAPMPGVITKLTASPGDKIEAGAPLLIMEAMKMEHTLKAPTDGVLHAYKFNPGDQIKDGDLLVEFEETA